MLWLKVIHGFVSLHFHNHFGKYQLGIANIA